MEASKEVKKLSYEELENVAIQLQHRAAALENQLRSINTMSIRLNYLFQVINNKVAFPESFVNKCSEEIMEALTIEDPSDTVNESETPTK